MNSNGEALGRLVMSGRTLPQALSGGKRWAAFSRAEIVLIVSRGTRVLSRGFDWMGRAMAEHEKPPEHGTSERKRLRAERLAAELRVNLKKRKAVGRTTQQAPEAGIAGSRDSEKD